MTRVKRYLIGVIVLFGSVAMAGSSRKVPGPHEKAAYLRPELVAFVRPGLAFKVLGAQIAADGTITATYSVTDPNGLALDVTGVTTPGLVKASFIAAYIPQGQTQYTAYTSRTSTGALGTVTQAGADSGGTVTQQADGTYKYVFKTKAPAGFDPTVTHTIGIYGSRDLTPYGLTINYASTTFNFVPNGSPVTVTRDVVSDTSCNGCHDQISHHGGSRRGVAMCVLCHQPQTGDATNGNSPDFKVMVHKIHMGSQLPSVVAGGTYKFGTGTADDYTTVVFPADPRRCETCHNQKAAAVQKTNYLTKPSAAVCGSCHDDVNLATGKNHPGGPQLDDKQCATCHFPQGELEFDASIKGAHVVPTDSAMREGLFFSLVKVDNGTAGSKPTVTFTVTDNSGAGVAFSKLGSLSLTMAGPTTGYGYTSFGSDVTTPGYVSESVLTAAKCDNSGTCTYTFNHAVPANATGSFAIGIEGRRTEILLPGTTKEQSVTYAGNNKVTYFSVDGTPVQSRRQVVAVANCNSCHIQLQLHGGLRNNPEYCIMCHNPSNTDGARRPTSTVAADRTQPNQGINFNMLIHRIHSGPNVVANGGKPYIVVGFGGSHNDFSDVRFPAFSPQGNGGDTRNCSICHVNGSEQNLPFGLAPVLDPQGPISPVQPITGACTGCHTGVSTASHALANTTILGESCAVCHGSDGAYAVGKSHAQY